jgi:cytochrome oxidase Cu insertion factor (SCO1/SenC/PrrC family)
MLPTKRAIWTVFFILVPMLLGGWIAYSALSGPREPVMNERATGQVPEILPVLGFVPDFLLMDQEGKEFGLKDLAGKAWVANFIFTRCRATCPAQSKNLSDLERRLRDSSHAALIRLVSVSIDPEHDTPQVLGEYAAAQRAGQFWHFLTGPLDDVRSLSEQGFKLPAGGSSDGAAGPAHSSQFALVDKWGLIRGYYDGVAPDVVKTLARDLERLAAENSRLADSWAEVIARRDPAQVFNKPLSPAEWLRSRQHDQRAQSEQWPVFHDFKFSDRLYASGIRFRNRVVDDAAKEYKPVHYDHGTGLAVADVDGDGLADIYFVNQVGPSQLWRNAGGGRFEDITERAGVALAEPIKVSASFADINNDGAADLYVTTVRGGNESFLNDGKGNFRNATADSGLGLTGHYGGAVFFDYDRDGLLDLFLCEVGVFSGDIERQVAEPLRPPGSGERDLQEYKYYEGLKDAFGGHLNPERNGQSRLLRNQGNARFRDVTQEVGLDYTGWNGDATPIDGNSDGWPDLYILHMQGNDEYFENQAGQAFIRKSRELFPKTPYGSHGVKVFDYNNDGVLDLFITDMHSDMSKPLDADVKLEKRKSEMAWPESFLQTGGLSVFGNALFDGANKFDEISDRANVENYWPWGPSVGDLNADGFADVFITAGMSLPYRYGVNSVLLNDGGQRFHDAEFVVGVEPRRGWRTAMPWFALDDSEADAKHPAALGRGGPLTVWSSLSSRSSAVFDLDDDGDLDIVTNEFNAEPMMLVSNLSDRRKLHFLKVRLVGAAVEVDDPATPSKTSPGDPAPRSNRDGVGALVRVFSGGRVYLQVSDGKSGYMSQSCLPLYFGLGEATEIEKVEVIWPSGHRQTIAGPIAANELLTVKES